MGRAEERLVGFDTTRFDADFRRVCADRGVSLKEAAFQIGLHTDTLYFIKCLRAVPGGATLAAMCKWSGLSAADYSTVELRDTHWKRMVRKMRKT
jgi:hypothetical protein